MALDRLDAVVIGAGVEGLAAAAALAKAGRAVTVVEREAEAAPIGEGEDAVIALDLARTLDLASQGLRFAAAPPVVGLSGERALILWPDRSAAESAIAAFSARDAEALEPFHARIARAAQGGELSASAWLTSASADGPPTDAVLFRVSPLARLLDEAFDNDLLKGLYAFGAIMGTGASPLAPASGVLLRRQSMLAAVAPDAGHRFVAGGRPELRRALLALLKFYNNADVRFAADVKEVTTERDAVQAVVLADGTTLRAPQVISTLPAPRHRELLAGLRRPLLFDQPSGAAVEPAHVKLTIGALPKLPGLDTATLASGAIVRFNPTIARLARAHGAFRARALSEDPCLELRVVPVAGHDKQRWNAHVRMPYVPLTTTEGPWAASRRDALGALCVRILDTIAPGFGASIEAAELRHPKESETVMDPRGAAALTAMAALDLTGVPEPRAASATTPIKGLTVLEPSLFAGDGDAGLLAAGNSARPRTKAGADA
ncbi:MAG: NAD-binding protein [Alphaproteobacteria bacterium]|nr:NAD-binding protein [Alphaproteobacteria bacterium]